MSTPSGLRRYWIRFSSPAPIGFALGCGVTAFTEDDARALVSSELQQALPSIESIEIEFDVSTLDVNHVVPNMGDCTQRGIWYPRLGVPPLAS
ncbi:MAG: hypothetical protein KF779_03625 [Hyphomonadaceae bacterium]|nr:hypothetical protein [Hyphomonadaceae bacterium]